MPSSSKPSGIPITTVILSPKNGLPRTSIPTSSMPAGLANKSPSSQNAGHEEQRPNARASHNPRCSPDAHPARALGHQPLAQADRDKLDALLAETLRVAHASGALELRDLARVTADTTVQPKAVTHPTDAKLMLRAIEKLGAQAKAEGLELRQSYARLAKRAAQMARRYTHAKQFKRANRELKFLRTRLGLLIRDITRKIEGNPRLEAVFTWPLSKAMRIRSQNQHQRGPKLYAWHAPEVECIGKGKAHKPYEFGVKVAIATTNRRCKGGQFVLHAKALPG